jgi:hypothetical protein
MWVAIGSMMSVFLIFRLFPMFGTGSVMPLVWNVQGWIERPLEFVADWLPFAAAAVYAGIAWTPTRHIVCTLHRSRFASHSV